MKQSMTFKSAAEFIGIEYHVVVEMVRHEWILPVQDDQLDDQDIARIRLILDLRNHLGVNDDSVPIILHLIDQVYSLREQMSRLALGEEK